MVKQRLIDKEKRTFSQRFVLSYISWSIEARQAQKEMQLHCFDIFCPAKHVMCRPLRDPGISRDPGILSKI